MIYDKEKGKYLTEGKDGDREWLNKAWFNFFEEVKNLGGLSMEDLFIKWGVLKTEDYNYIKYPEDYLKRYKELKIERDMRLKLIKMDEEYNKKKEKYIKDCAKKAYKEIKKAGKI